jgi:hypothetical protein
VSFDIGIKHRLCEIDVNITNGVIFFKTSRTILHRNKCANITFAVFMAYTISMHISYSDVIYPDLDVNVLMMLAKWYITRFS